MTVKKGVPPNPSLLERAAAWFIKTWSLWERAFGRTSAAFASRLRFSFFLAMTVIALGFLFWDFYGIGTWNGNQLGGGRSLASAEDSLFDSVIAKRPVDPESSGRVIVAEIDQCSIDYFEKKGEAGWPWPRDRHADLLTALGDAGVTAVGYDVLFLDKQAAQVFVYDADGKMLGSAPALLGLAIGDDSTPGVGDRELSDIAPKDRTTPAGRFQAAFGPGPGKEKVFWVDYGTAISLHPVITTNPKEHRPQRLRSPTVADNRITFGCINVPPAFYRQVVAKTFGDSRGIVYILPEVQTLAQVFPMFQLQLATSAP